MSVATSEFWEQRYQEGTTRWDLGQAAPTFVNWLQSPTAPPPGRLAVLGCGRGYEALLFASFGFEVMGFDFAPSAIAAATSLATSTHSSAQFLQRDIFSLTEEFAGAFDYVVEHTCFCAIAPEQRAAYVNLVSSLLRPGGELLGLFFTHARPGGPPFGSTPTEIRQYFEPKFKILALEPALDSVSSRQGEEHRGHFQVK
ncbi:MAG: methyltransferase domain-containing protein [Leptolyngbyaceae bacterium]|nr:methyltransferase domain-containing protein [Leptolyngbyaceae bacterium]